MNHPHVSPAALTHTSFSPRPWHTRALVGCVAIAASFALAGCNPNASAEENEEPTSQSETAAPSENETAAEGNGSGGASAPAVGGAATTAPNGMPDENGAPDSVPAPNTDGTPPLNEAAIALADQNLAGTPQPKLAEMAQQAAVDPTQINALAGAPVTVDEYKAGHGNYVACLASLGAKFELGGVNMVDGWRVFGEAKPAEGANVSDLARVEKACRGHHVKLLEAALSDGSQDVMDSTLQSAVKECLANNEQYVATANLEAVGAANNMVQMVAANPPHAGLVKTCVEGAMAQYFPNEKYVLPNIPM